MGEVFSRFGLLLLAITALSCAECKKDFDCPATQVCVANQCATAVCRSDESCAPGQRCDNNRCLEQPPIPAPSAQDAVVIGAER